MLGAHRANGLVILRKDVGRALAARPSGYHGLLQRPCLDITFTQTRSKKTSTVVRLSDLPQGPLSPQSLPALATDPQEPAYPKVVLQARHHMRKFDNCVLLTRVGGFYELYLEHAEEYGPLLNLKVASKKTSAGPVAMAGFPFFQLDRFLKILVQDLNRFVAVAEEFPNDAADKLKSGGLMHDRRVSRIITPGTLIDENFMDPYANNYVMAIHVESDTAGDDSPEKSSKPAALTPTPDPATTLGLAWIDLSTGHFFTQPTTMASLASTLSRISPREVILDQALESQKEHDIFRVLAEDKYLITYSPPGKLVEFSEWAPFLESDVPKPSRNSFTEEELLAGDLAINYVKDRLQGLSMKLQVPQRYQPAQVMNIDKNSLRSLEIKQTVRDGTFRGSLLHAIRRTVTKSGARLLNEWLSSPSTSLGVINDRLDLVAYFVEAEDLRDSIVQLLRQVHDSQRLVQKFALGRGDPDDLLSLAHTIKATHEIMVLLEKSKTPNAEASSRTSLDKLIGRMKLREALNLAKRIANAIDEEGIMHQHETEDSQANQMLALAEGIATSQGSEEDVSLLPKGKRKREPTSIKEHYAEDNESWIMKPKASTVLKRLHEQLSALFDEKTALIEDLRKRLGAPSLTLRWSPGLGHIAHIKGKDARNLNEHKALSSSKSTRSLDLPEWTALGQQMDQVRNQIRSEEQRVFQSLRELVVKNLVKLRRNSTVLDELDIATSFAKLAVQQQLVRPVLDSSTCHTIIGGRHPTVEGGLYEQGRNFVKNDCLVGSPTDGRLWFITGPNMAGKSTFLRQNALITIMAQMGCYVPASYAKIGIVDAIFSRVGSADDLYRDQSTFMVEMLETAQILSQATPKSFVIMDEIGRGTTPEDGTAVSFACLHHLVTINKCRTLFATHFHEVADLATKEGFCDTTNGTVQMYCTDVEEDDEGGFVYIHKLRKGINRKSHALKVASLARLPQHAIDIASKVLGTNENANH
ncbi:muts domain V [Stachybotrys elegans]|uniref:Muts domain V n=1 Tax=Stachybotrys elegans TaxID=80388 RepID=A0A8K0WX37_9HYPO|nr:muts domain V [Stachybotrys elegans]